MFEIPIPKKINILFNNIISNKLFILLLILFIIITIILILKKKKIIFLISIFLIISILIFISYNKFFNFLDYFVDTLFNILYFPNFAVFTLIIVYINFKSLFKLNKLTIIFYYPIMYLFILIINIIKNNNIALNSKLSIYTNSNLLSLIEITTFLFLLYIIINIIIFLSKKIHFNKVKLKKIEVSTLPKIQFNIDTIVFDKINISNYNKTNQELLNLYASIKY